MTLTATVMNADGTTRQVEYPPAREPEMLNCGHMSTPTQIWPGYAVIEGDYRICAHCAADVDIQHLKDKGILFAYARPLTRGATMTRDTRRIEIITWAGVQLGTGYLSERIDGGFAPVQYVTATCAGVKVHGRYYPDAGEYTRLRPYKRQD